MGPTADRGRQHLAWASPRHRADDAARPARGDPRPVEQSRNPVGTAAMDLLLYSRYSRGEGKDSLYEWEFAGGVMDWSQASAPGQLGQKLERLVIRRPPPDRWARATTNIMHWATGIGWGVQYGVLASRTSRHPLISGLALGPVAWLASYAILPLAR